MFDPTALDESLLPPRPGTAAARWAMLVECITRAAYLGSTHAAGGLAARLAAHPLDLGVLSGPPREVGAPLGARRPRCAPSACLRARRAVPVSLVGRFEAVGGVRPVRGEAFVPVPEEELSAVVTRLGALLPAAYVELATTLGAARFVRDVRFRSVERLPARTSRDGGGLVRCFYGAAAHYPFGLVAALARCGARMPAGFLPVADNGAGDQLALATRGVEAGRVYYWDHDDEPDERDYLDDGLPVPAGLAWSNVTLVATSFEAFLDQLWAHGPHDG
jgi:hypothetical protein